jgi:hypothetical protein
MAHLTSWPDFDPAIQVFDAGAIEADAQLKAGHDVEHTVVARSVCDEENSSENTLTMKAAPLSSIRPGRSEAAGWHLGALRCYNS